MDAAKLDAVSLYQCQPRGRVERRIRSRTHTRCACVLTENCVHYGDAEGYGHANSALLLNAAAALSPNGESVAAGRPQRRRMLHWTD